MKQSYMGCPTLHACILQERFPKNIFQDIIKLRMCICFLPQNVQRLLVWWHWRQRPAVFPRSHRICQVCAEWCLMEKPDFWNPLGMHALLHALCLFFWNNHYCGNGWEGQLACDLNKFLPGIL